MNDFPAAMTPPNSLDYTGGMLLLPFSLSLKPLLLRDRDSALWAGGMRGKSTGRATRERGKRVRVAAAEVHLSGATSVAGERLKHGAILSTL